MSTRIDLFLKSKNGFTFIELLLANLIALIVMGLLVEVFLITHKNLNHVTELQAMQVNAELAINILINDVHQAGHIGCPKLSRDFPLNNNQIALNTKLTGNDHELTVRYASLANDDLLEKMLDPFTLYVSNVTRFHANDILMISDCQYADIFKADSVVYTRARQKILSLNKLQHLYQEKAEVSKLEMNTYFVGLTNRRHRDGSAIYALFKRNIAGQYIELVDEINAMSIRYSVKQNNIVTDLAASQVMDWSSLLGVAIDLDVGSPSVHQIWHVYIAL